MAVLPGVLGCSFDYAQDRLPLRRTVQVRLGSNPAVSRDCPARGTSLSTASRRQFMKHPGLRFFHYCFPLCHQQYPGYLDELKITLWRLVSNPPLAGSRARGEICYRYKKEIGRRSVALSGSKQHQSLIFHHRGTESTELILFLPDRETAIGQKNSALRASFLFKWR